MYAKSTDQKNLKMRQIATAALTLFQEKSFFQITMADIAQEAHVAKGTLFNYYSCKESIFMDLLLVGYQDYFLFVQEQVDQKPLTSLTELRIFLLELTQDLIQNRLTVVRLNALRGPVLEKAAIKTQTAQGRQRFYQITQKLNLTIAQQLPSLSVQKVNQLFMVQSVIISGVLNLVGLDQFNQQPLPRPLPEFHLDLAQMAQETYEAYLTGKELK